MLQRQAAEPTHFLALPDDVFGLIYASLVWDRESKAAMHHTCRALYSHCSWQQPSFLAAAFHPPKTFVTLCALRSPSINDQNQTLILEQAAKTDKFAKLKAFPKNATLRYLRLWDGSAMTCLSASVQGHLCDVERLEVRVSVLHSDSWTSACLYWQVLGPGIGKEFMDWEVFASSKR
eukprot:scaffold44437_cov17-Tisochrysis_lutea.AAC.1